MIVFEMLRLALRSLVAKKLRTLLTMLGIVVGIGSVIVLLAYGEGTSQELLKRFESWGAKQIQVRLVRGTWRVKNPVPRNIVLTYDDVDAIRQECSAISKAVPIVYASGKITYRTQYYENAEIFGTETEIFEINEAKFAEGRPFSLEENLSRDRVCVIGSRLKERLFYAASAVGQHVTVEGKRFLVVGVQQVKDETNDWFGYEMYVPLLTVQDRMTNFDPDMELTLEATELKYIDLAERQVRELIRLATISTKLL